MIQERYSENKIEIIGNIKECFKFLLNWQSGRDLDLNIDIYYTAEIGIVIPKHEEIENIIK